MSDRDEPAPDDAAFDDPAFDDPAFDDPAFDDLRGLLADTRVTEPIPADVAARLDATLGALREERRAEVAASFPVVPLRRRAGRLLVAAAAVVAVGSAGFGIAQIDSNGSGNGSATSSDRAAAGSVTPSTPPEAVAPNAESLKELRAAPHLTSAHFARDVVQSMRTLTPEPLAGSASGDTEDGATGDLDARTPYPRGEAPPVTATPAAPDPAAAKRVLGTCPGPEAPDAVTMPATLDGALVALVFRPPTADAQVVEAWSCDGATLLASATVPH